MSIHKSVLLKEAIEMLNLKKGDIVVDATLGGGGHTREILKKIGEEGKLIAIDADMQAIENFEAKKNVFLVNDNFANLENILKELKIEEVSAILADLGWSSDQLIGKGMSFQTDEPLDMRLSKKQKITAQEIVNGYEKKELERIFKEYGEEKFWKSIARKIIEVRSNRKIETTKELVEIINQAVPEKFKHGKLHPATRAFQAIRIEVNSELENLEKFIKGALETLKPKGRLAVISFHSLEDKIVKNSFRENARGCICPPNFPQCVCGKIPKVSVITKKPVRPGKKEEMKKNPRARSAKMRVAEKK
jgi:16S rRNA (cytosine1402-N4)-methyltransferase